MLMVTVPLQYQREFSLRFDPAVVKVDELKKPCLTTQKFIYN